MSRQNLPPRATDRTVDLIAVRRPTYKAIDKIILHVGYPT